jgi:hypothetical protein
MLRVLDYVAGHPGCSKGEAGAAAMPEATRAGYTTVERTIRAGLVAAERIDDPQHRYALSLTDLGAAVLRAHRAGGEADT